MIPKSRHYKHSFQYHLVLSFIFMISCAPQVFGFSQNRFSLSEKFIAVHTLQDERDVSGIIEYFSDIDPHIRKIAFEAMASVQDSASINDIMIGLSDADPEVRIAAAYSLGQTLRIISLPDPTLELKFIKHIASESDPRVARELFISLGTAFKNPETSFLSNYRATDPMILEGIAWGIYRSGLNGSFDNSMIKRAFSLLKPELSKSARLGSAHFFARTKDLPLDEYADDIIQIASNENDPEVRMALILALGKVSNEGSIALLTRLIETDSDERVRINAIRSLSKIGGLKTETPIRSVLKDENINVSIAAAEHFETAENIFFPGEILKIANTVADWRVRAVLLKSLLKHSYETQSISQELKSRYQSINSNYEKAWILDALAVFPGNISFIQDKTFSSDIPIIRTYGMDGLCNLIRLNNLTPANKSELTDSMINGVNSSDPVMISLAAGILADPELQLKELIQDTKFLYDALQNLTLPRDYEAAIEIVKAIENLEESDFLENIFELEQQPIDWTVLNQLSSHPVAEIHTNKGTVRIELFKEDAPGTVSNFVHLSKTGFYNGKSFHRVVPNFVIQGGCPRGDGWGSSDATIRSEFSRLEFNTGYVGMASSGKDTESCQWFITHSPTPHLNGRYTIFGKVIEGMEIVNQIQVGDLINSIQIKKR